MRESQSGTAFQAGKDGSNFLSEGILSFVEYAPRLLIVLPSRQLFFIRVAQQAKANPFDVLGLRYLNYII